MLILIVGAGLSGATIARVLADNGINVRVIDRRPHVAGNAYDYINGIGERIHAYGPHILHGDKDSAAVRFLSRFTDWIPYIHRVRARLKDGRTTPLPINATTIEDVFNIKLETESAARQFIDRLRGGAPGKGQRTRPRNSDEFFALEVGDVLADIFFRPYTLKMWGVDPKELPVSVGSRLRIKTGRCENYFSDTFQALPSKGYTNMIANMLDHRLISVELGVEYRREISSSYDHSFLSVPMDEYFDYQWGRLPYRSIIFEHTRLIDCVSQAAPVINFTDDGPYTRMTQWDLFPNSPSKELRVRTITKERPCSMEDNPGEYYYPMQTEKAKRQYDLYTQLHRASCQNITFCGRTGLFRYIDMIPAVSIHLQMAKDFLLRSGLSRVTFDADAPIV